MSHQTVGKTELRSLASVRKAAEELGLKVTADACWRTYYGYSREAAALVLSKEGMYDVAVLVAQDGSISLSTDYYAGSVVRALGEGCRTLVTRASLCEAEATAESLGYLTERETDEDGTIRLVASQY